MSTNNSNYVRPIANGDVAIAQGRMILDMIDANNMSGDPLLMAESLHNLAHLVRPHDETLAQELMLAGDDFLQDTEGACL